MKNWILSKIFLKYKLFCLCNFWGYWKLLLGALKEQLGFFAIYLLVVIQGHDHVFVLQPSYPEKEWIHEMTLVMFNLILNWVFPVMKEWSSVQIQYWLAKWKPLLQFQRLLLRESIRYNWLFSPLLQCQDKAVWVSQHSFLFCLHIFRSI